MYHMISRVFVSRNGCLRVKKIVPLNRYIGMVETFSSYQKLQQEDPAEAERFSNDIRSKWDINLQLIHKCNR